MIYKIPKLKYSYDALEPYIDAKTMEIHYSKHHATYAANLNTILEKYQIGSDKSIEELLMDMANLSIDEADKNKFRNNAGGAINHSLFWSIMAPKKEIDEELLDDLKVEFGSIDEFKKNFANTALSHFGSGWVWLSRDKYKKLKLYSLPNQDSPYSLQHTPVIGLDVWEHAYYLKYQNRRAEYIENWWNILKLLP